MAAILNFPTKKWTRKMETVFFQSFGVNISEKSQLFKIYMKKSQNDTMPYTIGDVISKQWVHATRKCPSSEMECPNLRFNKPHKQKERTTPTGNHTMFSR